MKHVRSDATAGRYDLVVASDMTLGGDTGLRIATEAQVASELGMRTGLLHLPQKRGGRVSADIEGSLRRGWAQPVGLGAALTTKLLVVHGPGRLKLLPRALTSLGADKVIFVHDCVPDARRFGPWLPLARGRLIWAPTNRWVRAAIEDLDLPVEMEEADWRPSVRPAEGVSAVAGSRLRLGVVLTAGDAERSRVRQQLAALVPADGSVEVHLLGATDWTKDGSETPAFWTLHHPSDIDLGRFLSLVDVLACFASEPGGPMPDAAIALAMASGKLVAMPPVFRAHFGPGLLYCDLHDVVARTAALLRDT